VTLFEKYLLESFTRFKETGGKRFFGITQGRTIMRRGSLLIDLIRIRCDKKEVND
jgi:hypothetical protein